MPSHSHTGSTNTAGEHSHSITTVDDERKAENKIAVGELPSHNHTGSTNTTGEHTHQFQLYGPNGDTNLNFPSDYDTNYARNKGTTLSAGNHSHTININNTGSSQSHNNMQPYLAVYMWKRTA